MDASEAHHQESDHYDRKSELEAFDDTKSGVKGLVDGGITKVPKIFIHNQSKINNKPYAGDKYSIPIVNMEGIDKDPSLRREVINKIREASETWGFFQITDHGIPATTLKEMIEGMRKFHEQDNEVKKQFYTRDESKKVIYNTNYDFYQIKAANWRDSLYCLMAPHPPCPEELPAACR